MQAAPLSPKQSTDTAKLKSHDLEDAKPEATEPEAAKPEAAKPEAAEPEADKLMAGLT